MDGLSTLPDDPNWYPFARELGHIQNIGYGLPFAADALVLIRHPDFEIHTWADILSIGNRLYFPAENSRALAMLSFYIAAGGSIVNEQGLPTLEEQPLRQTLTLFHDGLESGTFAPSLLQSTGEPSSEESSERMLINWSVNNWTPGRNIMQPIPGEGAAPHAFANGWLWALAGSTPENQQLATELAEYLLEDDFLREWTREVGYLPTRVTLVEDQDTERSSVLESAQVLPSQEVVSILGPIMSQAVSRVLNGEPVEVVVPSVMEQFQ
jgi:ABC-type glycerol-3-phosphate transport system substrate-binding protein